MDTVLSIDLIATNPQIRNGRPHIRGTTITVADIAIVKVFQQLDVDEIAEHFELPLSQVHAALAYYYAHKAAVDASITERRQLAEDMKAKHIGSRPQPLFG